MKVPAIDASVRREIEAALQDARGHWKRRLEAIQVDRRHQSTPLEADSEDQAIQLENDEALDALDLRGRQELAAIAAALERLEAGRYGRCTRCGSSIGAERLRAQPTATACAPCARAAEPGE